MDRQFNILLTIQGFTVSNFTHLYFLRDMRLRDKICSMNIEFKIVKDREFKHCPNFIS